MELMLDVTSGMVMDGAGLGFWEVILLSNDFSCTDFFEEDLLRDFFDFLDFFEEDLLRDFFEPSKGFF
jgi:hypothetical protein